MLNKAALILSLMLAGCTTVPRDASAPVEVQILAINDFHGNLEEQPAPVEVTAQSGGAATASAAGGAARLAATLRALRTTPDTITVAAGDLIGASPLTSAYFLDEPTIAAMNLIKLDLASVGNHEFDKGSAELLRMQNGGCAKYTSRIPCRLEPYKGARFQYLGANVLKADGTTLFPGSAIRQIGPVRIGFIGMTLKETGTLVTPAGVAGLRFADEAATANALVPRLKAAGADLIVLLIHQGGKVPETFVQQGCNGLSGGILPILDALDPAIRIVVSGHTHNAYACEIGQGDKRRLLTSAGKYGYLVTDIRLSVDPATRALLGWRANNATVDGSQGADPDVAALVARYDAAAAPAAERKVGRLSGPAMKSESDGESPVARLIADGQLAATRAPGRGGAQISFINATGMRTSLVPAADGSVTYGQIFALQPFGNGLVVKSLSGRQLKGLLEQQFRTVDGTGKVASLLVPSANFRFAYDISQSDGNRVSGIKLDGKPIDPAAQYRVVVNNFLASGGDGFSVLAEGGDAFDAGLDLDALEAWLATNPAVPNEQRTTQIGAQ
jgi:5'-nucleotidase